MIGKDTQYELEIEPGRFPTNPVRKVTGNCGDSETLSHRYFKPFDREGEKIEENNYLQKASK